MMSTLSPAVPTPISQGEQRTIYNLCARRALRERHLAAMAYSEVARHGR